MKYSPLQERIDAKIQKDAADTVNGCWIWIGACSGSGYPRVWAGRDVQKKASDISVQDYMYRTAKGEIPKNTYVTQTCKNRKCVNPNHLILSAPFHKIKPPKVKPKSPLRINTVPRELDTATLMSIRNERGTIHQTAMKYGLSVVQVARIKKFVSIT